MIPGSPTALWRISAALVAWVVIPGEPPLNPLPETRAVQALTPIDSTRIGTGYGLPMAEIPAPPEFAQLSPTGNENATRCNFLVRAVVAAESTEDSFAMVEWAENRRMVRVGDSLTHESKTFEVIGILQNRIEVRVDGQVVRCWLDS